jgi:hypothetical protein
MIIRDDITVMRTRHSTTENKMTMRSTILAAAIATAAASVLAVPVSAAPMSGSLGVTGSTQTVAWHGQWRGNRMHRGDRMHRGNWIGPAAGLAAGAVIGGVLASGPNYDQGYNSYGYADGGYNGGYMSYGSADPGRGYMTRDGNTSNTGRNPTRRFADPAKGENN